MTLEIRKDQSLFIVLMNTYLVIARTHTLKQALETMQYVRNKMETRGLDSFQ